MPVSLLLIIVGIILICVAYYVTMPPPLHGLCMAGGVICVAVGIVILVYGLLVGGAGIHLAMAAMGVA